MCHSQPLGEFEPIRVALDELCLGARGQTDGFGNESEAHCGAQWIDKERRARNIRGFASGRRTLYR